MAKRGRKPRQDVPRYVSGRINYTAAAAHDEALSGVLRRRARQWGIRNIQANRAFLMDPRHSYELGRLAIIGERSSARGITADQHTAGLYVWRASEAYQRLVLGLTPHPKGAALAMEPEAVTAPDDPSFGGGTIETPDERIKRVTARHMAVEQCLLSCGKGEWREAVRVCRNDLGANDLHALRRALDAVFRDFGLG